MNLNFGLYLVLIELVMLKLVIKILIYNMLKKLIQLNIGLYEYIKLKNLLIVYKQKMFFDKFNDVNQFIHHQKHPVKYENKV